MREASVRALLAVAVAVGLAGCACLGQTASLQASSTSLDFGNMTTELPLMLHLSGDRGEEMAWRIEGLPLWASATPSSGVGSTVVAMRIERFGCGSGDHEATIRIIGPGEPVTVSLHMFVGGG